MKKLNYRYRGKNKTTDVLAFPAFKNRFLGVSCFGVTSLGDIIISAKTAQKNAKRFGNTFEEELKFLMIHGFLHLLGYDHEISRREELRMQKKEKEYMRFLEGA